MVALVHASVARDMFIVFFNITGCAGTKLFGMKLLNEAFEGSFGTKL